MNSGNHNNTDQTPVVTTIPDYDPTDEYCKRYSWLNGDNCVYVEELKVINGGHNGQALLGIWTLMPPMKRGDLFRSLTLLV